MALNTYLKLEGESGKEYGFIVYSLEQEYKEGVIAIYAFIKENIAGIIEVIYIGQTTDLSQRFINHHKEEKIEEYQATHIAIRIEQEDQLDKVEKDLIKKHNPPCNDHYTKKPL